MRRRDALAGFERAQRARGLAPETRTARVRTVRRFLAGEASERPLAKLTTDDLRRHLAGLEQRGHAPSSQAGALTALRAFVRWLVDEGVLDEDPSVGLVVRVPVRAHLLLSEEAVRLLLAAALQTERDGPCSRALAGRDRALLELLYGLGLRAGEARAARVVDLDLGSATLWTQRAKGGRPSALPIPGAALPYLRRYLTEVRPALLGERPDHGLLLVSRTGRPLRGRGDVHRVLVKVARRVGVRCHPHALRRAVATHLLDAGVSARVVQLFLGHNHLESTAHYLELQRRDLARTVELLETNGPEG